MQTGHAAMKVVLRDDFAKDWTEANAFDKVAALAGDVIRQKEGRRTLRFKHGGEIYYVKHHRGVGWAEIGKSMLQLKMPVTSANNEWEAIHRLRNLAIPTLTPVAYGIRGLSPASRESFLITRELRNTLSLAKHTDLWPNQPPRFSERLAIIKTVADTARRLHGAGINHRDLYLCHFLMKLDQPPHNPVLFVVDLHRAQCRNKVPRRWLVKDVASIYFSAMNIGLSKRDVFRFMRFYFGDSLKHTLNTKQNLLLAISHRADRLYRRDFRKEPPGLL